MSGLICVVNLGLKSMRAAVFDDLGRRMAIAYRPIESRMGEGRVEQDPDAWWRAAQETIGEVLADRAVASDVSLMTATASAGCLVAMDAVGRVVRPAIMISDVRAQAEADRIQALPEFVAVASPTGRITPDQMLPKIAWLRSAEPDAYDRTRWFASPNDFLIERLTGAVVTDRANATKFLHDPDDGYPLGLLRALDIDPSTLPPVAAGSDATLSLRPALRERFGLGPGVRVVLSTYDAICAVYGSGVADIGDACDVSGTVTSFRAVTDRRDRDPAGRLFTIPHVGAGRYLAGGSNNLGGGVIEWAKQVLYPDDPDPYASMVGEAEESPPGAAGLTFLPYLLGERAPVWDASARAVFFGLGRNHGRPDMIRAIFEGVGYSVLDIADHLARMGVVVRRVSASGGLARIDTINQIKSDMLGVPVVLTDELETSALGAALVAGVTAGTWSSIEEASAACVRPSRSFEPVAARTDMYRDFFGLYRELYGQLRSSFGMRQRLLEQHAEVLRTVLARSENL